MKPFTLVDHPLIQVRLAELRNENSGTPEFRRCVQEIAALMVPEVTRNLETAPLEIRTPLETCEGAQLLRPLVLVPILRAGAGMVEGMQRILSQSSIGHIGIFRDEETLRPHRYYFRMPPNLAESEIVLVDPMLATGWSAVAAIKQLKTAGAARIRFVCIVSCPEGMHQLQRAHPEVPVFTAAMDRQLNGKGYILPGLGDAGDRYYGT